MIKNTSGKLRSQIVWSFLLALLPIFLITILAVELFLAPAIITNARNELVNTTRILTSAVEASAEIAIRNHLRAITEKNLEIAKHHLTLVQQGVLSQEEAVDRLERILLSQQVGSSGYIYCLNSQGDVVVHPNKDLRFTNISEFEFVQEQLSRRSEYIEYDWKNPGELEAREKALYMTYFEPLDWIISASSYRSEFNQLLNPEDFNEMVLSVNFGESGYAYVLDQSGETLIHPKYDKLNLLRQEELPTGFVKEMLAKKSGILEYEWQNPDEASPRKKLAAYETIPEYGWVVVSSSYMQEVFRPAKVARILAYGTIFVLIFATILISYLLSGKISRPVDRMIAQLDKNAKNNEHFLLPVSGTNELSRLGEEFNRYLETIATQTSELRRQQARYRSLFEANPDAIYILNGSTIISCNPATYGMFAGDSGTILGHTVVEFSPEFQPDGQKSVEMATQKLKLVTETDLMVFEWVHTTIDGTPFDAEVRLKPFGVNAEGEPLVLAFTRDITERKIAVDALRKSELKYRQLLENASDAIFIAQDGKMVFINNKTLAITGMGREKLLSLPFIDFIHPEDVKIVVDRHVRRLRGDKGLPSTYSFRLLSQEGDEVVVQLSTVLIEWDDKPATLNFLRDITDQMKMESALQQAQKMEAIGTLAGGIAHDFNNLLMGIQGRVSLMSSSDLTLLEQQEHLGEISEYVQSASGLTKQLLGFARGGKYDPKPVDLVAFTSKSTEMFGRTRKEVEMRFIGAKTPVTVEVDPSQIEQVLLNIFMNGWHAMPNGGTLTVSVSSTELTEKDCELYNVEVGDYALISISDNGVGMELAVLERIFDPFFTTKEKARGTGLGLASTYGIIQNHKGFITVDSEVEAGTEFKIFLPVSIQEVKEERKVDSHVVEGSGTVLIIDDEELILEVGGALLEVLGYTVVCAKGGEEAIKLIKEQQSIDLIILDLVMPGLDGSRTYDEIRKLNSHVPIMLSSGYSKDGEAEEVIQKGCCDFIQKPFTILEFSQKVQNALT